MRAPAARPAGGPLSVSQVIVVAPEPAPWLGALLATLAGERVQLFAPWRVAGAAPPWWPARVRAAWQRRQLALPAGVEAVGRPELLALDAGLRAWAGDRADRVLRARFTMRRAVDRAAAASLPADARRVIAPSLAARRAFARARAGAHGGGARCVLVEDLPGLRELHDDLDRAARAHPDCAFLRRFRADAAVVAHQDAERHLADEVLVRGAFAEARVAARGHVVAPLPTAPLVAAPRAPRRSGVPRVLLAGLAAARGGAVEAAAATAAARGAWHLLVQPGAGMEPADLLSRPHVARASDAARALVDVDLVIAPAWCELYPREVALAAALGVPVIATPRAAGITTPAIEVAPGDAVGLGAAIAQQLQLQRG